MTKVCIDGNIDCNNNIIVIIRLFCEIFFVNHDS